MEKVKQPKGLYIIAGTEVFERISFYSIAFSLVLYASAPLSKGGLGWKPEHALYLAGMYTLAAFTAPIIGGLISDKLIGAYRSVILGALMIITGHLLLFFATPAHSFILYIALFFTSSGTGFLKPCMPTLLGRLYPPNDIRQDGAFKIYYTGINIGGMVAGVLSGSLSTVLGYQFTLSSAAAGMFIGLLVFLFGSRFLELQGTAHASKNKNSSSVETLPMTPLEKKSFKYLILAFFFFLIWCLAYNVALSGTLTYYVEKFTDRNAFGWTIPTTYFMSFESVGIVVSAPILSFLFVKLAARKHKVHFFTQMNMALLLSAIAMFYLTYLAHIATSTPHEAGAYLFHYSSILIFIFVMAVSEVLTSPVMMSAISTLAPFRYHALLQGLCMGCIGFMGLLAGKVGALSLKHPVGVFLGVSAFLAAGALLFFIFLKPMVRAATAAENEMEAKKAVPSPAT